MRSVRSLVSRTVSVACLPQRSAIRSCSTNDVLSRAAVESAYMEWAEPRGVCSVDELVRGAQQAYTSVGVAVDSLVAVPMKDLEAQIEALLVRSGSVAPSSVAESATDSAMPANSPTAALDGSVARDASSKSKGFLDHIPLGEEIRKQIVVAVNSGNKGTFNPYLIAHPNDCVISAKIQSFQYFEQHKAKLVMEVEHVEHEVTKDGDVIDVIRTKSVTSTVEEKMPYRPADVSAAAQVSSTTTTSSGTTAAVTPPQDDTAVVSDVCDRRVSISAKHPATTIPRSAQAYVVVSLLVVTPPRRFYSAFDWFYDRIEGHDSENERHTFATIFSASTAVGVLKVFDHIVKLVTGSPAAFQISKSLHNLLRLPKELHECPPAKRKFLGMYLSRQGEWTVAEMSNSSDVFDFVVPGTGSDRDSSKTE
mmetsp:Transcript_13587/g.15567  ORF Transcript_13587/g.15567 Transcript_13587/m.15567 type:complete len:421 (+) Transcript_13587:39-1301(+)